MSWEYDDYLENHVNAVIKGFNWIKDNLPSLVGINGGPTSVPYILDSSNAIDWDFINQHDASKKDPYEYERYDLYFYGGNRSYEVVNEFNKAWLRHIHHNKHHWQYWVLINDEEKNGTECIAMPYKYIIEMICDWWSFSWIKGDLYEIFNWYDEHKKYIKLNTNTRAIVDYILDHIKNKLDEEKERND